MFSLSELREWYADLREEIEASIRQRESEQAAREAAVREAMTPTPEFTLGELL
jgi:LPS sulfotransferase NodH